MRPSRTYLISKPDNYGDPTYLHVTHHGLHTRFAWLYSPDQATHFRTYWRAQSACIAYKEHLAETDPVFAATQLLSIRELRP